MPPHVISRLFRRPKFYLCFIPFYLWVLAEYLVDFGLWIKVRGHPRYLLRVLVFLRVADNPFFHHALVNTNPQHLKHQVPGHEFLLGQRPALLVVLQSLLIVINAVHLFVHLLIQFGADSVPYALSELSHYFRFFRRGHFLYGRLLLFGRFLGRLRDHVHYRHKLFGVVCDSFVGRFEAVAVWDRVFRFTVRASLQAGP